MARTICILAIAFVLLVGGAEPMPAQQYELPAIGAAVGIAGGAGVTLGIVVARARWQRVYLDSADDLIHWQSAPMIIAPALGITFGLAGEDALLGSIAGSTMGLVGGAAVGAGLGWLISNEQEWPWAGGVIGGALGMSLGGILNGLSAWSRDDDPNLPFPKELRFNISVPVR